MNEINSPSDPSILPAPVGTMDLEGMLSDPQKFITMSLQQLGCPMPKQAVMENLVALIVGTATEWQTVLELTAYYSGVAQTLAMLIITGEVDKSEC